MASRFINGIKNNEKEKAYADERKKEKKNYEVGKNIAG